MMMMMPAIMMTIRGEQKSDGDAVKDLQKPLVVEMTAKVSKMTTTTRSPPVTMSSDNQKHPLVYCGPMDVDACSLVDEEEEKADATTPVEQLETKNAPVACNAAGTVTSMKWVMGSATTLDAGSQLTFSVTFSFSATSSSISNPITTGSQYILGISLGNAGTTQQITAK